jgi:enoyl-CoA hydratase/carnithine racemase
MMNTTTTTTSASVTSEEELALVEHHEGYSILTINRADKRNAMSSAAQKALRDALDAIKKAGSKAIVLTAAGDQSFCSGVDIKEKRDPTKRAFAHEANTWALVQKAIREHPAIVVGAVNGYALGGGLTLVNSCDLAIAVDTATFGMPEITFAQYPALAGPTTMRRILPKHAIWMTVTGQRIDAATALSWGLVNEVVPRERLLPRAVELAKLIATFDAVALDYTKKTYHIVDELGWDAGIDYGSTVMPILALQKDVLR